MNGLPELLVMVLGAAVLAYLGARWGLAVWHWYRTKQMRMGR